MFNVIRKISPIITIVLAVYGLVAKKIEIIYFAMFFSGTTALLSGITDIKEKRKKVGVLSVFVSIFTFAVLIFIYLDSDFLM